MSDAPEGLTSSPPAETEPSRATGRMGPLMAGVGYYYATGLIVLLAGVFSHLYVRPSQVQGHIFDPGAAPFMNWDGQWYKSIAQRGYSYSPEQASNVVFFPLYPLMARGLARMTGLDLDTALLLTSNACLLATFAAVSVYLVGRPGGRASRPWVLLSLGLAPTAFFFRMAYSESLFLLLTALFLIAIRGRWPLLGIALIAGLATAARPVGVGLIPALILHVWQRSPGPRVFAIRLALLLPVSCGGLIAYMAYQAVALGDPLIFSKAQVHWNKHASATTWEKAEALVALYPILLNRFDPTSKASWHIHDGHDTPYFSLYLADPFYFLLATAILGVGAWRRWVDGPEAVVGFSLLAVVVATKAFETDMEAFGRYAFANIPVLLAAGEALRRLPERVAVGLVMASGLMMAAYTAMFIQWYPTI